VEAVVRAIGVVAEVEWLRAIGGVIQLTRYGSGLLVRAGGVAKPLTAAAFCRYAAPALLEFVLLRLV
jgi:hypothetical protein